MELTTIAKNLANFQLKKCNFANMEIISDMLGDFFMKSLTNGMKVCTSTSYEVVRSELKELGVILPAFSTIRDHGFMYPIASETFYKQDEEYFDLIECHRYFYCMDFANGK